MKYSMVIRCMFCMDFWVDGMSMCKFLRSSMLFVCKAPLTPVAITLGGLTFQPCARVFSISGLHLSFSIRRAWLVYLLCVCK